MKKLDDVKLGKFISLVLRHEPEAAGITLDEHGWADVDKLINGTKLSGRYIDMEILERIVRENSKKRYSFSEDKKRIRANQGHSIDVDVELKNAIPPEILYHGTASRFMKSIGQQGLLKGNRQYVHLSKDIETAVSVGKRHGLPVVLAVDTRRMTADGYQFYLSENGVWLCESVPWKYITQIEK